MSKASSPRHSPRITLSGRMRRAFFTRSRCLISPLPSIFGGPRLHAGNMGVLQLQFGSVLNCNQALIFRYERRQSIEHGGFAGTGTTRNNGGDTRMDRRSHHLGPSVRSSRQNRPISSEATCFWRICGSKPADHLRPRGARRR